MTEDEYSELMRKALTNPLHWHGLTATPAEAREAKAWLEKTNRRIELDLKVKRAEWKAAEATHPHRSPMWRKETVKYEQWKASALRFQALVKERLEELRLSGLALSNKPASLQKAHDHSEYMTKQLSQVYRSLHKLVEAVAAFEAGDITTKGLAGHLDSLTVPHGGDGSKTLRQVLEDKRRHLEAVS